MFAIKNKAIAVREAFYMLIFIIALFLFSLVLFKIPGVVEGNILSPLKNLLGLGGYTSDEFRNAIACSYYRCLEGCDSDKVKSIKNIGMDEDGKQIKCIEFCKGFTDKKVCDDDALKNPVRIKLDLAFLVAKADFTDPKMDCIIPTDSKMINRWKNDIYSINFIIADANAIEEKGKNSECVGRFGRGIIGDPDALEDFKINSGEYYIYTSTQGIGGVPIKTMTWILTADEYNKISAGAGSPSSGEAIKEYCTCTYPSGAELGCLERNECLDRLGNCGESCTPS